MQPADIEIVFTDLDGTLYSSQSGISDRDLNTLKDLEKKGVTRVIATGRSLFSAQKVISDSFPIDYLVFSSGAGIIEWNSKSLLLSEKLPANNVQTIATYLTENECDFMLHDPIPDNHHFSFFSSGNYNPDFFRRIKVYEGFASPGDYQAALNLSKPACQFLAISRNGETDFEKIRQELGSYKIIRTTSPLDGKTTWIEIFPNSVSKAIAAEWICNHLKLDIRKTLAIGNDYNDIDLLDWAETSYLVDNGASELKERYLKTKSVSKSGFSYAITK